MQMLDQACRRRTGQEIDPDDAFAYATEKRMLQKFVTDTTLISKVDSPSMSGQ
jgi:twitching motility protein PilT